MAGRGRSRVSLRHLRRTRSSDRLPCPDGSPGLGPPDLLDDGPDGVLEAVAVGHDMDRVIGRHGLVAIELIAASQLSEDLEGVGAAGADPALGGATPRALLD